MDLTVEFTDIRDEPRFTRGGDVETFKRYTFFIGKHGPFVERVPLAQATDSSEITRRVDALKLHLQTLPA